MESKPNSNWEDHFEKKGFLDKFHLSVHELSELGVGWLIVSVIFMGTLAKFIK